MEFFLIGVVLGQIVFWLIIKPYLETRAERDRIKAIEKDNEEWQRKEDAFIKRIEENNRKEII